MYHKIRNTLTALSLAMGVIVATALFSGPAPAEAMAPAPAPTSQTAEERIALAVLTAALTIAANELAHQTASAQANPPVSPTPVTRGDDVTSGSGLRLQLGMPYYSFGAILPRRGES
jgi:hypothetical protein